MGKQFINKISKIVKAANYEISSWKTIGIFVLVLFCYLVATAGLITIWFLFLFREVEIIRVTPLVIFLILLVHFLFTYRLALPKWPHAKKGLVIIQIIFFLLIYPVLATNYSAYTYAKNNDPEKDLSFFYMENYFESKLIGGDLLHAWRAGPFIVTNSDNGLRLTTDNFLYDKWWEKVPILSYYLRLPSRDSYSIFQYNHLFSIKKVNSEELILKIYEIKNSNNSPFNLISKTKLPVKWMSHNYMMFNKEQGILLPEEYVRYGWSNLPGYLVLLNDWKTIVPIDTETLVNQLSETTFSTSTFSGIKAASTLFADTDEKVIYFNENLNMPGRIIAYNYENNRVYIPDDSQINSANFIFKFNVQKFRKQLDPQYPNSVHQSSLKNSNSENILFSAKNEGDKNTHLFWLSNSNCTKGVTYFDSQYKRGDYGCIVTSATTTMEQTEPEITSVLPNSILVSSGPVSCGNPSISYLLDAKSNILPLKGIPVNFMRKGFQYKATYAQSINTTEEVTYNLTSCNDPTLSYNVVLEFSDDKKINVSSYYPDFNKCINPNCNYPAVTMGVYDPTNDLETSDLPNVFPNEEETTLEVLFPQQEYEYIAKGNRRDVYQLLSNKFTGINIPIIEGMVHKITLDEEARKAGQKNWITLRIDHQGDGDYEEKISLGELFTGKEIIEKCGPECSYLESLI